MALAQLADLEALGAIRIGSPVNDRQRQRGERLLMMVSDQVLTFADTTEAIVSTWPAHEQSTLATIVAEIAARRLAAPTSTSTTFRDGVASRSSLVDEDDQRRLLQIPSLAAASGETVGVGSHQVVRADSWHEATGMAAASGFFTWTT